MTNSQYDEVYPEVQHMLSWQNAFPAIQPEETTYRYVKCTNRHYQKAPTHFSINLTSCDNNPLSDTCHPGSIIEGFVHLSLESPLAAQYIKLVFKAAEHIHNDDNNNVYKKKGERLFAIRTFLWGKYTTEATNKWPVIESGDHRIPFVCELPMVNYPPSFSHDLASCEFELVATIERPGYRPLQTPSLSIRYEPYVAISEPLTPYYETATVSPDIKAILTLPSGCGIHLLDPDASQFQFYLDIKSENHTLNGLEATIVRKMEVKYGSRRRKDTMVMCHSGHLSNRHVVLNLPTKLNQHKIQLSSKSFSFLGMTTSLSFSRFITLEYQLVVTCKVKQGLISTKKQLFCVPLSVGTLPPGEQVPSTISYYRDPHVTSDSTLLTKPKFLKAIPQEEQLPAYTAEGSPPIYVCKNF